MKHWGHRNQYWWSCCTSSIWSRNWYLRNIPWYALVDQNTTIYDLHHGVGIFYVSQHAPKKFKFWWCLRIEIRWDNQRHYLLSENCWWCSTPQSQRSVCIITYLSTNYAVQKIDSSLTDKFQSCQGVVQFRCLQITSSEGTPSESMLNAIINFPYPRNITNAKCWFVLVSQVVRAYSLSLIMSPFGILTSRIYLLFEFKIFIIHFGNPIRSLAAW